MILDVRQEIGRKPHSKLLKKSSQGGRTVSLAIHEFSDAKRSNPRSCLVAPYKYSFVALIVAIGHLGMITKLDVQKVTLSVVSERESLVCVTRLNLE